VFQLTHGKCIFENYVLGGTVKLTPDDLTYCDGDRWLVIGQTVGSTFPKKSCQIEWLGEALSLEVRIGRVAISLRQMYLSMKLPGSKHQQELCISLMRSASGACVIHAVVLP
jgi:hypothetical protein